MSFIPLILIAALGLGGHASPFDAPANGSPEEQASWTRARCKWQMVEPPQLAGYEMDLHIQNKERCFLEARLMMISASHDPDASPGDRALFRRGWSVIWDNHAGERTTCRMVPLKPTYAKISDDDLRSALLDETEAALAKLRQVADENIAIDCAK